jgi:hypothetical protein
MLTKRDYLMKSIWKARILEYRGIVKREGLKLKDRGVYSGLYLE